MTDYMPQELTPMQSAWIWALRFEECKRCTNREELTVDRQFFVHVSGLKRFQKHHRDALEDMERKGLLAVVRRGVKVQQANNFYRLSDKARMQFDDEDEKLKKHSWSVPYQPKMLGETD